MVLTLVANDKCIKRTSKSKTEIIDYCLNRLAVHDFCTFMHSQRVEKLAVKFARKLQLPPTMVQDVSTAALLHDIGKIAIPRHILQKPGKLTEPEFNIIKRHSGFGFAFLQDTEQLEYLAEAILYHHEKFNGKGYPHGISGKNIPLISRILSITDVYEAITSDRVYRKAMTQAEALQVIYQGTATHFDPDLVKIFLTYIRKEI